MPTSVILCLFFSSLPNDPSIYTYIYPSAIQSSFLTLFIHVNNYLASIHLSFWHMKQYVYLSRYAFGCSFFFYKFIYDDDRGILMLSVGGDWRGNRKRWGRSQDGEARNGKGDNGERERDRKGLRARGRRRDQDQGKTGKGWVRKTETGAKDETIGRYLGYWRGGTEHCWVGCGSSSLLVFPPFTVYVYPSSKIDT